MAVNTFFESLDEASYKGVPFFVKETDAQFGQSIVVHEFVQRDNPFVEDLGRKTRRFKFTGYVCANTANGFNPWPERDALIEAVEAGGEGQLILPDYGILTGRLHSVSVKTSTAQAGKIAFDFEFVESDEDFDLRDFSVQAVRDTKSAVVNAASAAEEQLISEFEGEFGIDGTQGFVVDDARASVAQFLDQALKYGNLAGVEAQAAVQQLRGFVYGINRKASDIARPIFRIMGAAKSLENFIKFTRPTIPFINTTSRNQQRKNKTALTHLIQGAAVTQHALRQADLSGARYDADSVALRSTPKLITRKDMESRRFSVVDVLTNEVYELSRLSIFNESQNAVTALRTAAVQHLTAEGETLARTFVTSCCDGTGWWRPMPAIMLAYRHYGVLNDDVIIERNEVGNPLFMPPNAAVELLHG